MRYHFFLHNGWFFQNLGKEAVRTFMHTTVPTYLGKAVIYFQQTLKQKKIQNPFWKKMPLVVVPTILMTHQYDWRIGGLNKYLSRYFKLFFNCYAKCWDLQNVSKNVGVPNRASFQYRNLPKKLDLKAFSHIPFFYNNFLCKMFKNVPIALNQKRVNRRRAYNIWKPHF